MIFFVSIFVKMVTFEDEEDEETYKRLRERERRQVFLRDYAEEYRLTTDYGDLILQQRSFIVRWIVEVSQLIVMAIFGFLKALDFQLLFWTRLKKKHKSKTTFQIFLCIEDFPRALCN